MSDSSSDYECANLSKSSSGESDSGSEFRDSSEEIDSDCEIVNIDSEDSSEDKDIYCKDIGNIQPYPAPERFPFVAKPGSTFLLEDNFDTLEYFKLFFDDSVLDILVSETNRYSVQQQRKTGKQWKPVDKNEMMIFLAINILQSLIKKPEERAYWSTNEIWCTPIFPKLMSLRRYKSIKKNLHFCNNETFDRDTHPNPKLYKIWPIYQIINKKCSSLYIPGRDIMIDESLMLYKGRLGWVQYIPIKRLKFGIKLFLLCESQSGYLFSFVMYTGIGTVKTDKYKYLPFPSKIVALLIEPLLDKGYCLTTDDNYTSPQLLSFLASHKTDLYGYVRKNWIDLPKFMQNKKVIKCQRVVTDRNEPARGVDRSKQHLPDHTIGRKRGRKYYRRIFFHLLDITIWNAYVLYKKNGGEKNNLEFRSKLVERLIESYHGPTDLKKPGRPKSSGILRLTERHFPSFVPPTPKKEGPTRYCAVCCAKRDSKGKRKRKESRYMCNICNVGLCAAPCFEIYHTIKDFE